MSSLAEDIRVAIDAARHGNFEALDRLEVDFCNVLVRIGELQILEPDGTVHHWMTSDPSSAKRYANVAPFVVDRVRGAGPEGRAVLVWQLLEQCRRCERLLRHVGCRVCDGRWWVEDRCDTRGRDTLRTTLDGVLIDEDA